MMGLKVQLIEAAKMAVSKTNVCVKSIIFSALKHNGL